MRLLLLISLVMMVTVTNMSRADDSESSNSWQLSRLFHPTEADLANEKKGRIMIYDGMTDKTVDRALDEHFDRIGALMFTRTIVTDDAGIPLRNPDTNEIVVEEDGCD